MDSTIHRGRPDRAPFDPATEPDQQDCHGTEERESQATADPEPPGRGRVGREASRRIHAPSAMAGVDGDLAEPARVVDQTEVRTGEVPPLCRIPP